MALLKKAKIGDLLLVPSYLLFPQRTGRWTRHNFSTARVTGLFKSKSTGAAIVEVEFYEAFRYRSGDPVRTKKFYVEDCQRHTGFNPIHVEPEKWEQWERDTGAKVISGKLFDRYDADTMKLFGIEP